MLVSGGFRRENTSAIDCVAGPVTERIDCGAVVLDAIEEVRPSLGARFPSANDQALTALVMVIARAAKSSASLECQARACSVTARCAAMRSWTSRRR